MTNSVFQLGQVRLFIDESGDANIKRCELETERYLCLTGVALDLKYHNQVLHPAFEKFKLSIFSQPVILHRNDILRRNPPFDALLDDELNKRFEAGLLEIISRASYKVFSVLIDKLEWRRKYPNWPKDVYQIALENLVERYALWLKSIGRIGDVVIEERGKNEDRELVASFRRIYEYGNNQNRELLRSVLTSKNLKVAKKVDNIAGLQISDLIVTPCQRKIRADMLGSEVHLGFGEKILEPIYASKYYRSPEGEILGYGIKIRP